MLYHLLKNNVITGYLHCILHRYYFHFFLFWAYLMTAKKRVLYLRFYYNDLLLFFVLPKLNTHLFHDCSSYFALQIFKLFWKQSENHEVIKYILYPIWEVLYNIERKKATIGETRSVSTSQAKQNSILSSPFYHHL